MEIEWDALGVRVGAIVRDWMHGDVRCLVRRGRMSWCGYVGLPSNHSKAGFSYDDMPLRCHGGLTFSQRLRGGWYFYGWDYAHFGDGNTLFYEGPTSKEIEKVLEGRPLFGAFFRMGKRWTIPEVEAECNDVAKQLSRLRMPRLKGKKRMYSRERNLLRILI